MTKLAIVGGGITGLACAHYILKFAGSSVKQIYLLESGQRLGGWIQTKKFDDGAIFELGPRSLRGFGKVSTAGLEMAEELGLLDEVLPVRSDHVAARNRYIYADNQLHTLPNGPLSVLRRSSLLGESLLVRLVKEPYVKARIADDDTIHAFMCRRFGHKVADRLVDPFVRGIYAGNSRELSAAACLSDVYRYEQEHGSVLRGAFRARQPANVSESELVKRCRDQKWSIWSLRQGLGQLTDRLADRLGSEPGVRTMLETPCRHITFNQDRSITVTTDAEEIRVDHVVAATNSKCLSEMVASSEPALSALLSTIEYVSVAVVNMEYRGRILAHQGFGHLIPSSETSKVLGVVYDSCAFPEHDRAGPLTTRLTCMMGGAWFEDLFGNPDSVETTSLEQAALDSVSHQLGTTQDPERMLVTVHKECIPQYRPGHIALVDTIEDEVRRSELPLSVVGAPYRGVAVNDCIHTAKRTARNIVQKVQA